MRPSPLAARNGVRLNIAFIGLCFPLTKDLAVTDRFSLRALCRSFPRNFRAFFVLLWPVCRGNLAVFLLAFHRVCDGDWNNDVLREATAQEMAIVETVGVDNPPGDVAMLDEALSGLGGLNLLLHAGTPAGWAAPSKRAVVLDIEVKFNILDSRG